MERSFAGKVVVVTGAGSGIGRAIAHAFALRGAKLHLTDVKDDRLQLVAQELRELGSTVVAHLVDSRQANQVEDLANTIFAQDGRVDILCNNAGVGHSGLAQHMPLAVWRDVIETNLLGPIHGVVTFLPRMLAQEGQSHIVNTASIAGLMGLPGLAAYCASKFGVVGLTEALSVEIPPEKVHVAVVCPGIICTNIVRDAQMSEMGAIDRAGAMAYYERIGEKPEQVANDVLIAVQSRSHLRLSAPGPYRFLWWLKRFSGRLYQRVSHWIGRQALTRGLPGKGRTHV